MDEENIQPRGVDDYSTYTAPITNFVVASPSQVNTPYTPATSFLFTDNVRLNLNSLQSDETIPDESAIRLFNSDSFAFENDNRTTFNLTKNSIILKKLPVPLSTRTIEKNVGDGTEVLLGEIFLPDSTFNNDCVAYIVWCPISSYEDGLDLKTNIVSNQCRIICQINVPFDGDSGFVEGVTGSAGAISLPDICMRSPASLWVVFRYTGQKDELKKYPINVADCYVDARISFLSSVSVYSPFVSDN